MTRELVARFHDAGAAERSQREFIARVSEKTVPTDLPPKVIQVEATGLKIANLLKEAGLAASTSEVTAGGLSALTNPLKPNCWRSTLVSRYWSWQLNVPLNVPFNALPTTSRTPPETTSR